MTLEQLEEIDRWVAQQVQRLGRQGEPWAFLRFMRSEDRGVALTQALTYLNNLLVEVYRGRAQVTAVMSKIAQLEATATESAATESAATQLVVKKVAQDPYLFRMVTGGDPLDGVYYALGRQPGAKFVDAVKAMTHPEEFQDGWWISHERWRLVSCHAEDGTRTTKLVPNKGGVNEGKGASGAIWVTVWRSRSKRDDV